MSTPARRDYPRVSEQLVDRQDYRVPVQLSGGATTATVEVARIPLGLRFLLRGVIVSTGPAAGTPNVQLYVDRVSPENLLAEVIGSYLTGITNDRAFWAQGGSVIIAAVSAAPANALVGIVVTGELAEPVTVPSSAPPPSSGAGMPDDGTDAPASDWPDENVQRARDPLGAGRPAAVSRWEPVAPGPGDGADWPLGPTEPAPTDLGY